MDQERTNRVQAVYDLWDCSFRPRIQKIIADVIADALEHSDEKTNGSLLTFETANIVEYQTLPVFNEYFNKISLAYGRTRLPRDPCASPHVGGVLSTPHSRFARGESTVFMVNVWFPVSCISQDMGYHTWQEAETICRNLPTRPSKYFNTKEN